MKEKIVLTQENFCEKLIELRGLSPIWEKVLKSLEVLEPELAKAQVSPVKSLLAMYFSRLDDGNICIPLESESLLQKIQEKWKGLLLAAGLEIEGSENTEFFRQQIEKALPFINSQSLPNLFEELKSPESEKAKYNKPFLIDNKWLFASKYHKAKVIIEERISLIFKGEKTQEAASSTARAQTIKEYFAKITGAQPASGTGRRAIELKERQVEAIVRGQEENLIITGGPGTGKTTVVCYLLWELLKKPGYLNYSMYLAAPSGKAADRMKESISETLSKISLAERQKFSQIFEKLNSVQSSTIHRLLSYNPAKNAFSFNKDNQFDKESIFVIDEASMIDINLFSSLLQAIPLEARVFILGDKDQLPSVQAGAVLGELLAKKTSSVVALNESNRFNDNSQVGRLKDALQSEQPLDSKLANLWDWQQWKAETLISNEETFTIPQRDKDGKMEYPVYTFVPPLHDYAAKKVMTQEIILEWSKQLYDCLSFKDSPSHSLNLESNDIEEKLDTLWSKAMAAKILCAERNSYNGVLNINQEICRHIRNLSPFQSGDDEYFNGQLLMLTKNQSIFNLFNGDSGIVVSLSDENTRAAPANEADSLKYLMVKKDIKNIDAKENKNEVIKHKGSYVFYPLYLLPKEALETAYAITIHKSQGSGYKAILIFLPEHSGHPLLNRQIAYTAITRTEGSTYIVARPETLEEARRTLIERDTQIYLDKM